MSEKPSSAFHAAWFVRRARSTRSKSTRTDVYTCALVAFDRTMCSAVRRRMLSNGTISSPDARTTGTAAGAGAGAGVGAGSGASAGVAGTDVGGETTGADTFVAWPRPAATTSLRVMRPPSPVPRTCAGSSPCSAIMRRTSGDVTGPPVSGAPDDGTFGADGVLPAGATGAQAGAGFASATFGSGAGAAAVGCGAGGGDGAANAADAAAAFPESEITASRAPTSTVSPSATRISETTPAVGAGTSESTLSVDTSNSGSSAATGSPTCLNQRVIVPSVTVSPSCGIVTSTNLPSCADALSRGDCGRSARAPTHRTAPKASGVRG